MCWTGSCRFLKNLGGAEVTQGFVNAISELVHPQKNLCSHGDEKGTIDAKELARRNYFRVFVKEHYEKEEPEKVVQTFEEKMEMSISSTYGNFTEGRETIEELADFLYEGWSEQN